MSFLSETAINITINLLSSLLWDEKNVAKERSVIKNINTIISDFSRKYDDTILDSYIFQKFINSDNFTSKLFNTVFKPYSDDELDIEKFKEETSKKAIEYVNKHYKSQGRECIKDTEIFYEYFSELIDKILYIRNNLLSFDQSALASIINQNIRESKNDIKNTIIKEIEKLQEDNIFAEDRIHEIMSLINLHKFSDAEQKISLMLESSQLLSISQRELLYYQRARILINSNKYSELDEIIIKIKGLNSQSKYLLEIYYYLACKNNDEELLNKILLNFEEYRYSQEKILLKKISYYFNLDPNYNVESLLLSNENLQECFKEYYEAHDMFAIILMRQGKYKEAAIEYSSAYELHNDVLFKYRRTVCEYLDISMNKECWFSPSDEIKEKVIELHHDLEELEYVINSFSIEDAVQYWVYRINLMSIIDLKSSLEEISKIDEKYDNEIIKTLKADIYIKNRDDQSAKKLLEKIWINNGESTIRYFAILAREDNWEQILSEYKKNKDIINKDINGIKLYIIEAKIKTQGLEKSDEEINNLMEEHKVDFDFLLDLARILLDNKGDSFFEKVFKILDENKNELRDYEINILCEILIKYNKNEEVRTLISDKICESEILLKYYFMSYGKIFEKTESLINLKNIVDSLYLNGCRFKILLEYRIMIYSNNNQSIIVLKTLGEYKKNYGIDEFYTYYFVGAKYGEGEYDGIEKELDYLLNTDNIFYHQLVANVKAKQGFWDEAKRIALKAIYVLNNILEKEVLINYINMFYNNIDKERDEIEMLQVSPNTVAILKNGDNIRKIAIHKDSNIIENEGENKFGCENYSSNYPISLILISSGSKGNNINIENVDYEIFDIIEIYTYVFRYCLEKLQNDYPDHGYFMTISGETPELLRMNVKEELKKIDKKRNKLIDMYNFENNLGLPISALSGKNIESYFESIVQLLNCTEQNLYAGELVKYSKERYVLSLSSIIILVLFKLEKKLNLIEEKCYIHIKVKKAILKAMRISNELSNINSGRLLNGDNGELIGYKETLEDKNYKKDFWKKVFLSISNIEELDIDIDDKEIYSAISLYVTDEDIYSIESSIKEDSVLVCDDLFVRRTLSSINEKSKSTNIIGLLISENLLGKEELIELILQLVKVNYLYPLNSELLVDIYIWIESIKDATKKINIFNQFKEIHKNILSNTSRQYYIQIYRDFVNKIMEGNGFSADIYELAREPLGLKTLEEFLKEKSEEFFMELLKNDI